MRDASLGLVLTGGGARAAYQVGALRALSEILGRSDRNPFPILAGISAGAVNCAALAAGADDHRAAVERLVDTWRSITPDLVYRTDASRLVAISARWIRDLTTGGLFGENTINFLLDTQPLRKLLGRTLPLRRVRQNIRSGALRGVAISATNYSTGTGVTFFEAGPDVRPWVRSTRLAARERIRIDHVMASAAIPLFFAPVRIGDSFYGDGCVRMIAPLSPAIHLGADRIIAIGVRHRRPPDETMRESRATKEATLPLSEIVGVLLNAVFLDSLESDVERLERINHTLSFIPKENHGNQPLRPIPVLVLRPSVDLGRLATNEDWRLPGMLRYLLHGIGATGRSGSDLLSYLAFEPVYLHRLLDLGYEDTLARRDEIEAFLAEKNHTRG